MADYGAEYADKKLRSVDRQLQKEYGQAEKELRKKLAEFTAKSAARDKYKRKQLEAGIITEEEYQSWLKGQVFQKKRWEAKIRQMQFVLHSHNEQAAKMIHENKLDVYNENYFHQAYEMEMVTGASFDLYSTEAVTKLIRDREQLLPEWKVDQKKDYNWIYDKANNAVTQGILQGESVDKIMNRLAENLSSQNESKMRMFARTAITGAQSAGRQQQMNDAAELGIEQLKQWLATLDGRTRDVHRHLDGQEVPFNESFDSDLGKIKYPGDPEAAPANVYNCRCTIITIYPKYRKEQDNWREKEEINGVPYIVWKRGKIHIPPQTGDAIATTIQNNYAKVERIDVDKDNEIVTIAESTERMVNAASKKITKDFPNIENYIKRVVFGNVGVGNPAEFVSTRNKETNVIGNVIALNSKMWSNIGSLKRLVLSESNTGKHIKTKTPKAIIAHEYGHGIYRSCIYKMIGYNGSGAITDFQINLMPQAIDVINKEVESIIASCKDKHLSIRANDDLSEYIAEAFSDYYYGTSRKEVSVKIVDYFKKVME